MSLYDAARKLLHHEHDDEWSPLVAAGSFCWACRPGTPTGPLCADCHVRAAATAYREGRTVFNHLDHIGGERSRTDSPARGLDR